MQSLASNSLPLGWFDGVVVLVLVFGIFRGRKNGMSKEILPLSEWFAVIFISGLFYSFVADWFARVAGLSALLSNIVGYLLVTCIIFLFFVDQAFRGFAVVRQQPVWQRRILSGRALRDGALRLRFALCIVPAEFAPLHAGANPGQQRLPATLVRSALLP